MIGNAAKNQHALNVDDTVIGFKEHLGSKPAKKHRFDLIRARRNPFDGKTYFGVNYKGCREFFTPLQLMAMLLVKLNADTQKFLKESTTLPIHGCVIAIPSYFSIEERNSMLVAAKVGGLCCHQLVKETMAVAICYGFYELFPKKKIVAFVDFGHNSLQVFICRFSDEKIEIIAEASKLIGGGDIDELLAEHFIRILDNPECGKRNRKFVVNLLEEVEKMKILMSSEEDEVILNTEPLFLEDIELKMTRKEMEEICSDLFAEFGHVLRECLIRSELPFGSIDSIELVGGSTRIPKVSEIVGKVFNKKPLSTMNRLDSVARGALYRMVMTVKRRNFQLIEEPIKKPKWNFPVHINNYDDVIESEIFSTKKKLRISQVRKSS